MQFSHFPQANDVLRAAPGTEDHVRDLHIFRPLPFVVSCVSFDPAELAEVVATGRVYLQVVGEVGTSGAAYVQAFQRFSLLADFADVYETAAPMLASFDGANAGEFLFMQPLPGQQLPEDSHACAVACYEFTEAQVRTISATGNVYVKALGMTHAPICVHAANPISFSVPAPEPDPTEVVQELGIAESDIPGFNAALIAVTADLSKRVN
jgi:hypothetical protein